MSLLICNATIEGRSDPTDLLVEQGSVRRIGDGAAAAAGPDCQRLDAAGAWLLPGLVDIASAMAAGPDLPLELRGAARSAVTTLVLTPRQEQRLDHAADVRDLVQHAARVAGAPRLRPAGAMTIALEGTGMADMDALRAAGSVAVSNGTAWVADSLVARCAMRYARDLGLTVLIRPVDPWLGGAGCAHAGRVATRLGLAGIPVVAETTALARDLVLVEDTGVRAHFGPLSSAAAVALVRQARERGLPVTADTTISHLFLTENDLLGYDPDCHVLPPFRSQTDREALRSAVAEGLLTVRSDHTPLSTDAKTAPFPAAEPGIASLPTLLGLAIRLVDEGLLDVGGLIRAFATGPAAALQLPCGRIEEGAPADLALVDPDAVWRIDPAAADWGSAGRNTPFRGWELRGRVIGRVLAGNWLSEPEDG